MGAKTSGPTDRPGHNEGRRALTDAAISVVAAEGLRGLTYRAVAKAARVSYGLVSHHFGSRDALISEALASTVNDIERATFDQAQSLEDFADEWPSFIAEHQDLLAFQYDLTMEARRRPELMPDIQKMYGKVFDTIHARLSEFGVVRDDEEGEAIARFATAALDGMILQQIAHGDPAQTERSIKLLQRVLAALRDDNGGVASAIQSAPAV